MSKRNREKRREKAKRRAAGAQAASGAPPASSGRDGASGAGGGDGQRRRAERPRAGGGASDPTCDGPRADDGAAQARRAAAEEALVSAAGFVARGLPASAAASFWLADLDADVLADAAEAVLLRQLGVLWRNGWQPAEVHRQARRGSTTLVAARLVWRSIATDHAARRSTTLDGRWSAQLEGLRLPPADGRPGWARQWMRDEGLEIRSERARHLLDALASVIDLPRLETLVPPPGAPAAPPRQATQAVSDPVLTRIRALLAKAESTSFEAEAEAFTAKAYELMARHSIDAAVVASGAGADEESPEAVRLWIDAPYADAKAVLLGVVAASRRCSAVSHGDLGLTTVVGFAGDLAAVEVLFTSLLVQAQRALGAAANRSVAGGRTRTQAFRSSFLLAYAHRVAERLREIDDAVTRAADADLGGSLLPVLASREQRVAASVHERFPKTAPMRVRGGGDAAGWTSGRAAADLAELTAGRLRSA